MSERLPQYHKYQNIESEVEEHMEKCLAKKLVTTTVSSREVGINRREEGTTMRSRVYTETRKDQRDDKMEGDGDFPCCMRRKSEDNEAKMREHENSRRKGGGRHKLRNVDGEVPLSFRSYCEERSNKEIEDGNSEQDSRSKTACCGSKDLCGSKTIKENKESAKTEEKDITFIVLQDL